MLPNYMKPYMVIIPLSLMSICIFYMQLVLSLCLPCAKSTVFNDLKLPFANNSEDRWSSSSKTTKGSFLSKVIFSPFKLILYKQTSKVNHIFSGADTLMGGKEFKPFLYLLRCSENFLKHCTKFNAVVLFL